MKTFKNLYPQITSFTNLDDAWRKARKGKRQKPAVAAFEFNAESELFQLQRELQDKTYRPGSYRSFFIQDSKKRKISAAPFRDRVVHHALCNVLEPRYEPKFIPCCGRRPAVPPTQPSCTINCMETYKIQEGTALYSLTFTVVHWLPVFVAAEPCLIVTESLNFCHQHKGLRINAFVIMPTHLHLIGFDVEFDNERLRQTINALRQFTGRRLADYCHQKMPAVYGQQIGSPRRQDRANQFWQPSKHPVAIWSEDFWRTKFNYLHDNPRRKGLVHEAGDWRFSSAAYWLNDQIEGTDVTLTGVVW